MKQINIEKIQERLYNSKLEDLDKNLKALLRAEKERALAKRIDDQLER